MRRSSRRILRFLGVKATYYGQAPTQGLLVSNHVSYLDILVFGQAQPLIFISKSEVRDWPFVGWLTRCAGTLFIHRKSKSDVIRLGRDFTELIKQGAVVALFPEGTSSDGTEVLPFRSALLEPAARYAWAVSPTWIGYTVENGSVEQEICYWGDMSFGSHLLNLLCKKGIQANVVYRPSLPPGLNRKQMTRELHKEISRVRMDFAEGERDASPTRRYDRWQAIACDRS
jgi:1-acyl-sn-glycerol-3-phosphate acyltransferase